MAIESRAFLARTPFVGRARESARLESRLEEARAGRGGLVMLVGEPGIGKSRLAEEFAERARHDGGTVLWGRCYDGEWTPPYGPFAEAVAEYVRSALPEELRHDLGSGAPPIARLVPALREKLPDIEEPAPLQPDEERFRLLDAVSQFLTAISRRAPVVIVLDDLHWADKGTVAMLRHVARFASSSPSLLLGAYRDVELDRQHPLADALKALRTETNLERLLIEGLAPDEVSRLIAAIAEHDVPEPLVQAISAETDGNPFFVREVLLDLAARGAIYRREGRWTSDASSIAELDIPEGVRQVIARRLSLVSEGANRLLTAGCAFGGAFPFDLAASVAGLDEAPALDAIDQALEAQLVRPDGVADRIDFVHANIRHTLYSELSPPRQARLHRQIAEAMAAAHDASDHAAEIAYHYHRSSTLPGAEYGVEYALAAADKAEASYAREDVVSFLRTAVELLPERDERRPRVLGRLGLALAWALDFDEALKTASEAGDLIAAQESDEPAAGYLEGAARSMYRAGFARGAFALAERGLRYTGGRRDVTWAWLMDFDLMRRQAMDPKDPGVDLDGAERREAARAVRHLPPWARPPAISWLFDSREDVLRQLREYDDSTQGPAYLFHFFIGDYRKAAYLYEVLAREWEARGLLADLSDWWSGAARCHVALGEFEEAREATGRAVRLARRLAETSRQSAWQGTPTLPRIWPGSLLLVAAARSETRFALGDGEEKTLGELEEVPEELLAGAPIVMRATGAALYARFGRIDEALRWLSMVTPALECGPGWANSYNMVISLAALTLWILERTDHIELIERNLREKVLAPDFRHACHDSRLSLARLCALQGRHDEAVEWFARARDVLDEQGARPLRAIADYDEALMYVRRGRRGDRGRAVPLVEAALSQFHEIGMTGWVRRGEDLQEQIAAAGAGARILPDGLTPREADVLRLIAVGRTNREIAEALTLSVRTVGRHIENIYRKIGVRNKAEATVYAGRKSLT